MYMFTSKSFLIRLLTLSQISLYFLAILHSLSKKTYLVSSRKFSRKFSTQENILNSGQNSELRRKLSTQEKILNPEKNSQLKRKF